MTNPTPYPGYEPGDVIQSQITPGHWTSIGALKSVREADLAVSMVETFEPLVRIVDEKHRYVKLGAPPAITYVEVRYCERITEIISVTNTIDEDYAENCALKYFQTARPDLLSSNIRVHVLHITHIDGATQP